MDRGGAGWGTWLREMADAALSSFSPDVSPGDMGGGLDGGEGAGAGAPPPVAPAADEDPDTSDSEDAVPEPAPEPRVPPIDRYLIVDPRFLLEQVDSFSSRNSQPERALVITTEVNGSSTYLKDGVALLQAFHKLRQRGFGILILQQADGPPWEEISAAHGKIQAACEGAGLPFPEIHGIGQFRRGIIHGDGSSTSPKNYVDTKGSFSDITRVVWSQFRSEPEEINNGDPRIAAGSLDALKTLSNLPSDALGKSVIFVYASDVLAQLQGDDQCDPMLLATQVDPDDYEHDLDGFDEFPSLNFLSPTVLPQNTLPDWLRVIDDQLAAGKPLSDLAVPAPQVSKGAAADGAAAAAPASASASSVSSSSSESGSEDDGVDEAAESSASASASESECSSSVSSSASSSGDDDAQPQPRTKSKPQYSEAAYEAAYNAMVAFFQKKVSGGKRGLANKRNRTVGRWLYEHGGKKLGTTNPQRYDSVRKIREVIEEPRDGGAAHAGAGTAGTAAVPVQTWQARYEALVAVLSHEKEAVQQQHEAVRKRTSNKSRFASKYDAVLKKGVEVLEAVSASEAAGHGVGRGSASLG